MDKGGLIHAQVLSTLTLILHSETWYTQMHLLFDSYRLFYTWYTAVFRNRQSYYVIFFFNADFGVTQVQEKWGKMCEYASLYLQHIYMIGT